MNLLNALANNIVDCINEDIPNEEIVKTILNAIQEQKTYHKNCAEQIADLERRLIPLQIQQEVPVKPQIPDNLNDRRAIAYSSNTSPETLKVLATDEDFYVRWNIAYNSNTSPETLKVLSTDKNPAIRRNVAYNPNTSLETLRILSTDEHLEVQYSAMSQILNRD